MKQCAVSAVELDKKLKSLSRKYTPLDSGSTSPTDTKMSKKFKIGCKEP